MGDFLLDVRPRAERALDHALEFLKFFPDMRGERYEQPEFGLVSSSPDNPGIWGSFHSPDQALFVGLCGRIALESKLWGEADRVEGRGGLACKHIARAYREGGIQAVEGLSGNFVILLHDRAARKLFLTTDRWGMVPAFRCQTRTGRLLYGSHPDAVADAAGESRNWDLTSFAEFVLAGRLSAPFTYYERIKALPVASTTTLSFAEEGRIIEESRVYFRFDQQPQTERHFDELTEQFAAAFRNAVSKRTLPELGRSAVALSGGLDSRTVLSAAANAKALLTFSCYDSENREFRIARSIAHEAGAEFVPLKRDSDYYGDHALLGTRISAGMGCIASNHFLGVRTPLKDLGVENLLTGCYCDYLFKGLAVNRRWNRLTTREHLGPFSFSYYSAHFTSDTALAGAVRQRLEQLFPSDLRRYDTESNVLNVERRRVFPLCYEEDNAERTIPQRVMGWYAPVADNGLMEVILRMSVAMKLNRRLFARMVQRVCGENLCRIPDANTGAPVNASPAREAVLYHLARAEALWRKIRPSNATSGSWLNWNFYAGQSRVIQELWKSPNAEAGEVFRAILGKDQYEPNIAAYPGKRIYLFLQLFTLKLWLDQRPR